MTPLSELLRARPLRLAAGGKETSGTVVVIGGPTTCPGAALLAATAALRVGAGRVQAVVHPDVAAASAASAWELLVDAWDQDSDLPPHVAERVANADVVVVGPGHHHVGVAVTEAVASCATGHLILDAGALCAAPSVADRGVVLAPNTAEAAELVASAAGGHDEEVLAKALVERFGAPVAVRGRQTVVAEPGEAWSFDDAPPGLGTPGSGDVLIGALAGLIATGTDVTAALGWAVHLHATAGRRLADRTPVGYLASDIATELPVALAGLAVA